MDNDKKTTYVIGHKNPDTDAIAAAISYAYLKNLTSDKSNYEAMRCGNINSETQYVLDRFNIKPPRFIGDVRTQVKDMEIRSLPEISSEMSLKEAWLTMKENNVVTLCITEGKYLKGLITTGDIVETNMAVYESDMLSKTNTSYENIAHTLDGTMITGELSGHFEKGKVLVGAGNAEQLEEFMDEGDIVLIGNRYEAQLCSIEMGASLIIVCGGYSVSPSIQKIAEEKNCRIMTTPHDTFTVARLINMSMPVGKFMKSNNLITFKPDDYIEDIKPVMAETRHRYFPVVDSKGYYVGMVSRRNFLGARKKRLILVDHNERSQAVQGVETAELAEIIDHHRLGTINTGKPIFFRNQPLGSTCTIIYTMYLEAGIDIPKDIAGIMLSAIISDTLLYRSPTATQIDKNAGSVLSVIAGVNEEELAKEMFSAGSNLGDKTASEIIHQDFKKFSVGDTVIAIAQISSMDVNELHTIKERIEPELDDTLVSDKLDMVFIMLTNILKESSEIIYCGANADRILEAGFGTAARNGHVTLNGVVSRKKQMLPAVTSAIQGE